MTHIDLFSGIGAMPLAARWLGIETIALCEIDPFCQRVLNKNFPGVPLCEDVYEFTDWFIRQFGRRRPDIITGGFPCQDISQAGRRDGIEGERSGLWFAMLHVCTTLRPSVVVVENVAGIFSAKGMGSERAIDTVCRGLSEAGYTVTSTVLSAGNIGAPHERERAFILGVRTDGGNRWALSNAHRGGCGEDGNESPPVSRTDGENERVSIGGGAGRDVADAKPAGPPPLRPTEPDAQRSADSISPRGRGEVGFAHFFDRGSEPQRAERRRGRPGTPTRHQPGGGRAELDDADERGFPERGQPELRPVSVGAGTDLLAHADCGANNGRRESGSRGRRQPANGSNGDDMAHATSGEGERGEPRNVGSAKRRRQGTNATAVASGGDGRPGDALGVSGGERLQERNGLGPSTGPHAPTAPRLPGDAFAPFCRGTHGLSGRVDGSRPPPEERGAFPAKDFWPRGRGREQYDWEPERTVPAGFRDRCPRLKALGNAIVPQVAYIILQTAIEAAFAFWEDSQTHERKYDNGL